MCYITLAVRSCGRHYKDCTCAMVLFKNICESNICYVLQVTIYVTRFIPSLLLKYFYVTCFFCIVLPSTLLSLIFSNVPVAFPNTFLFTFNTTLFASLSTNILLQWCYFCVNISFHSQISLVLVCTRITQALVKILFLQNGVLMVFITYRRWEKIRWAKYSWFQRHWSFHGNTFALPWL